jgi:hypothetical protein
VPWSEITITSERHEFARRALQRRETLAELCEEFRVSEKTGYKWLARFRDHGVGARGSMHRIGSTGWPKLSPLSLIVIRQAHPTWGPRKLLAYARARDPRSRGPRRAAWAI